MNLFGDFWLIQSGAKAPALQDADAILLALFNIFI
jgi:hypothetical protein